MSLICKYIPFQRGSAAFEQYAIAYWMYTSSASVVRQTMKSLASRYSNDFGGPDWGSTIEILNLSAKEQTLTD